MPRAVQHVPRIIMENSDKIKALKLRPIKNFKIWKILKGDLVRILYIYIHERGCGWSKQWILMVFVGDLGSSYGRKEFWRKGKGDCCG